MLKQYQSINKPETKKPIHKTKLFTYSKRQETSIKTVATPKIVADNQIDPKTATISEQGQGINFMQISTFMESMDEKNVQTNSVAIDAIK